MRQMLAIFVLLLGVTWMAAQDSPSSGSTTGGQTVSSQTSGGSGSHTSVEGCLSGSDGKYMLTDKQGMSYQLTGDASKLADHVGHEIKVTGVESSGSASATGSSDTMGNGGAQKSLEVSSVKHISKTCKSAAAGGGMSH